MKNLFLILSLFFSLNVFATGNTTMNPASIQRINNASLTCPTGKWCRVIINAYLSQNFAAGGSGNASITLIPGILNTELILKGGDVISAIRVDASNFTAVVNVPNYSMATLAFSVSSVVVAKVISIMNYTPTVAGTFLISTQSDYSFYSMEYWN